MSEQLFDGTLKGGSRVQQVVRMMNFAPGDPGIPYDFIERLLVKAEREAYRYLCREIEEAMRGDAARRFTVNG